VIAARFAIARLFLGEGLANADATIALAAQLLLVGATFFITDALQTIAAGALRGLNDTRIPLIFAAVSYWVIGFCSAYALAFHTTLGATGVWIGLSLGTLVYAALLILRFRRLASGLASELARSPA
jgi:multidrug resistance protein, MATE family